MQEIRCPRCGEVFQVDETGYAQIAQQVRDKEFEKELERRAKELKEKQEEQVKVARLQQEKEFGDAISQKNGELAEKDKLIEQLKAQLAGTETEKKLAVAEAIQAKEQEITAGKTEIVTLQSKLSTQETEAQLREKSLQEQYEEKLKTKEEQIEYYRDFKARQSTKMIGESLEQHCLSQFNSIRMAAFPSAYFEKDNDARAGSKGDFIKIPPT